MLFNIKCAFKASVVGDLTVLIKSVKYALIAVMEVEMFIF